MAKSKRNQVKIRKILEHRGYKGGKLPTRKVAHHIKPKAKGGKDTPKNIWVISEGKHKKIHRNRIKRGEI